MTIQIVNIAITKNVTTLITNQGQVINVPYYETLSNKLFTAIISSITQKGYFECEKEHLKNNTSIQALLQEHGIDTGDVNVQTLKPLVDEALESGNDTGLKLFIEKLKTVNADRSFSVDSCVSFLEHNDMPITTQGNILGYKWFNVDGDDLVDTHTGKIHQRVGSVVKTNQEMVDPNRAKECSYGLHVASKEYANRYYGDAVALVLVHPEDIISVPEKDHSKMRVMQYQILFCMKRKGDEKLLSKFNEAVDLTYWVNHAEEAKVEDEVIVDCVNNTYKRFPASMAQIVKELRNEAATQERVQVKANETITTKDKPAAKKVKANRVAIGKDSKKNNIVSMKRAQVNALVDKFVQTGTLTFEEYDMINTYKQQQKKSLQWLFPQLDVELFKKCYKEAKSA